MKLHTLSISTLLLLSFNSFGQTKADIGVNLKAFPKADVAILGTFHFASNADSYKRRFHLDIGSEQVQKELESLNEKLKKYQPTKVMVEYPIAKQNYLDSLYRAYLVGSYKLRANEVYQLGFRLAKSLEHDRIYAIDVQAPLHLENEIPLEEWGDYAYKTGHLDKMNAYNSIMEEHHRMVDSLKTVLPLTDYFKFINSEDETSISGYEKLGGIVGLGATDTYVGADGITMDYRRNLRIYANVLSLIEDSNDRFLIIYGSNHKFILGHLFQSSPELNYVDVIEYLK